MVFKGSYRDWPKKQEKNGLNISGNKRIELKIAGMACSGCSATVEKSSLKLPEQDFRRVVEAARY